jgi:hypothetical protein
MPGPKPKEKIACCKICGINLAVKNNGRPPSYCQPCFANHRRNYLNEKTNGYHLKKSKSKQQSSVPLLGPISSLQKMEPSILDIGTPTNINNSS